MILSSIPAGESVFILRAAEISVTHGLLSGDALVVASMESYRLTLLASNDDDFDRVTGISRYAPI